MSLKEHLELEVEIATDRLDYAAAYTVSAYSNLVQHIEKHKEDKSENQNSQFESRDQGTSKWMTVVLTLILKQTFIFKSACLIESANTWKGD